MIVSTNDEKFYHWELNTTWQIQYSKEKLTLKACQRLINQIKRDYDYKGKIQVKDGRGSDWARCASVGDSHQIHLPKWARTLSTVLHETAHAIAPIEYETHGPTYLMTLAMLLERYLDLDPVKVVLDAKRHGVPIAPLVL